jgi:hypothetical protein
MIRVAAVITRLQNVLVADQTLRSVGGAGDLADVKDYVRFSKTAFVLPKQDAVEENRTATMMISQRVRRRFSVLIGFTKQRVRNAQSELDQVEDVSEAVKAALVGWVAPGEDNPVTFLGAGVAEADYNQGFVLWADDFECVYELRKARAA